MGTWFWLNIPLAALFLCCWSLIPLWLTLTRWHAEVAAKHAEIAARAAAEPAVASQVPATEAAYQIAGTAYAGTAAPGIN